MREEKLRVNHSISDKKSNNNSMINQSRQVISDYTMLKFPPKSITSISSSLHYSVSKQSLIISIYLLTELAQFFHFCGFQIIINRLINRHKVFFLFYFPTFTYHSPGKDISSHASTSHHYLMLINIIFLSRSLYFNTQFRHTKNSQEFRIPIIPFLLIFHPQLIHSLHSITLVNREIIAHRNHSPPFPLLPSHK